MISMLALGNLNYALEYEEVVNDRALTEEDYRYDKDKVWESVRILLEAEKYALESKKDSLEKQFEKDVEAENDELVAQIEDEDKVWESVKKLLEAEKDALESEKDSLEKQFENTAEAGDAELADLKAELDEARATFKVTLDKMKAAIKTEYTEDELEDIAKTTRELEENGMQVLPVENVLSKKSKFKFDVPPIIKEGRTLIPVRPISEAFGAQVAWDEEAKMVIITKENINIALRIDDKMAEVNDQEVVLDVPAEIMNSRTVVPLRFIGESFGLNIEWDEGERIIEIE